MRLQLARRSSSYLPALAAVGLSLARPALARAGEANTIAFDNLVYSDTDNVLVVSPQVSARHALDDRGGEVSARAVVDVVSAASVDVVSHATNGFTEIRRGADLAVSHRVGEVLVGGRYSYSDEPDYRSHSGGLSLSRDFADHDTTLTASYDLTSDTVGRTWTPFDTWSRHLSTHTAEVSWTQVLNPRTIGRLAYTLTVQDGYLEKPYRYVPLFDAATLADLEDRGMTLDVDNFSSYRLPERPPEEVPDLRVRHAFAVRALRYLSGLGSLEGDYRLYLDSWGMQAHTLGAAVRIPIGRFRFDVEDRLYWQGAVDFWRRAYTVNDMGEAPGWRTLDRDLATYVQDTLRLRGQVELGDWTIYGLAGAMVTRYSNYMFLDWRTALIGEVGVRWRF